MTVSTGGGVDPAVGHDRQGQGGGEGDSGRGGAEGGCSREGGRRVIARCLGVVHRTGREI